MVQGVPLSVSKDSTVQEVPTDSRAQPIPTVKSKSLQLMIAKLMLGSMDQETHLHNVNKGTIAQAGQQIDNPVLQTVTVDYSLAASMIAKPLLDTMVLEIPYKFAQ